MRTPKKGTPPWKCPYHGCNHRTLGSNQGTIPTAETPTRTVVEADYRALGV